MWLIIWVVGVRIQSGEEGITIIEVGTVCLGAIGCAIAMVRWALSFINF